MSGDPNIHLLKPRFQGFLEIAHGLPVLRGVLEVKTHANQLVLVQRTLIKPPPTHHDCVGTRRSKVLDQFIVGLEELFLLDRATVVIEQREQDFEPDHERPSLRRR